MILRRCIINIEIEIGSSILHVCGCAFAFCCTPFEERTYFVQKRLRQSPLSIELDCYIIRVVSQMWAPLYLERSHNSQMSSLDPKTSYIDVSWPCEHTPLVVFDHKEFWGGFMGHE